MSNLIESSPPMRRPNPLIWISLIVVGVIIYILLASDRDTPMEAASEPTLVDNSGEIERSLLIPPGMRARQYIAQIREESQPYPHTRVFEKGLGYQNEGSLADAYLLFFFSAREEFIPAIMKMGEMADPALFVVEDSLLDHADVIQAYKWYKKAAMLGHEPAAERMKSLQLWAMAESKVGNPEARQLLLNFE